MAAKKCGTCALELTPTLAHRNIKNDRQKWGQESK